MRALAFALLALLATPLAAQAPAAGSNWQRVQALAPGTSIYLNAKSAHLQCRIKSVGADSLTCTGSKDITVQRTEVATVKIPHRSRSALIASGVGAGAGAIVGFALGTHHGGFFGDNFLRGAITAVGAVVGAPIGATVGYFTDLNRSTVYRAPSYRWSKST